MTDLPPSQSDGLDDRQRLDEELTEKTRDKIKEAATAARNIKDGQSEEKRNMTYDEKRAIIYQGTFSALVMLIPLAVGLVFFGVRANAFLDAKLEKAFSKQAQEITRDRTIALNTISSELADLSRQIREFAVWRVQDMAWRKEMEVWQLQMAYEASDRLSGTDLIEIQDELGIKNESWTPLSAKEVREIQNRRKTP